MDGLIFPNHSFTFFNVETWLERIDSHSSRIVAFKCEAVWDIATVSLAEDRCAATRCSRIPLLIFLVVHCIVEVALTQIEVYTVQSEDLRKEDLLNLQFLIGDGISEDKAPSFGSVAMQVCVEVKLSLGKLMHYCCLACVNSWMPYWVGL